MVNRIKVMLVDRPMCRKWPDDGRSSARRCASSATGRSRRCSSTGIAAGGEGDEGGAVRRAPCAQCPVPKNSNALSPYFRFRLQCPVPNASPCFPRRTGNSGLEELESALSPNWSLPCPQCFQTRATPMLPDAAPSPRLPDGHPCFLTPTLSVSASAKDLCIACRLRIQVGRMSRSSRSSARNRSRSRCKDACSVA